MEPLCISHAKEHIKVRFEGDSSGHDAFHSIRVYNTATHICKKEGGDLTVVQLAALLHDVDDRKLFGINSNNALEFMKSENVPEEAICKVVQIISQISFKGTDSVIPDSLEGKIVQDADRLDAIGAIGIARAFAFGGSKGRVMYDPDEPPVDNMDSKTYFSSKGTSVNHFYEKLLKLKDMMNTDTAKAMATERHEFMLSYLEQFYKEWNGE